MDRGKVAEMMGIRLLDGEEVGLETLCELSNGLGAGEPCATCSASVDHARISPNSTDPRSGRITKITIHHVAGNLGVEALGEAFADPARRASANYGIGSDGRVGLYVHEQNRAWTSGSAANDHQAVTIEVANSGGPPGWPVSDAAFAALVELCAGICRRNGIARLFYDGTPGGSLTHHGMFQETLCPGPYLLGLFPQICDEVNARLREPILPGHDPSAWAAEVWAWGIRAGVTDGTRPREACTREEVVALIHKNEHRDRG